MKAIAHYKSILLTKSRLRHYVILISSFILLQSGYAQNQHIITGVEVGQKAPELKFKSPEGNEITLSSLHGKMVLIDFWASWCRPCRFENPNIVNAYNNFKDKDFKNGEGFTIYSVSLDQNKTSWVNAISADKLSWEYHVSDLAGWRSRAAALYGVRGIPASFLIDGDGIIVAKGKSLRGQGLVNTLNTHVKD
jgi:thiol-disulfide isomerase/thioredoxin